MGTIYLNEEEYGGGGGSSQEVYTSTEEVVGQWTDGKLIYRQVLETTVTGTDTRIDYTIPPIDRMIKFETAYIDPRPSAGSQYNTSGSDYVRVFLESNKWVILVGGSYPQRPLKVTTIFEYTKTTD